MTPPDEGQRRFAACSAGRLLAALVGLVIGAFAFGSIWSVPGREPAFHPLIAGGVVGIGIAGGYVGLLLARFLAMQMATRVRTDRDGPVYVGWLVISLAVFALVAVGVMALWLP